VIRRMEMKCHGRPRIKYNLSLKMDSTFLVLALVEGGDSVTVTIKPHYT